MKTDYITKNEFESMYNDVEKICKILGKIQITAKNRNS